MSLEGAVKGATIRKAHFRRDPGYGLVGVLQQVHGDLSPFSPQVLGWCHTMQIFEAPEKVVGGHESLPGQAF